MGFKGVVSRCVLYRVFISTYGLIHGSGDLPISWLSFRHASVHGRSATFRKWSHRLTDRQHVLYPLCAWVCVPFHSISGVFIFSIVCNVFQVGRGAAYSSPIWWFSVSIITLLFPGT